MRPRHLKRIPPAATIRDRIALLTNEIQQLHVLLQTAEKLEPWQNENHFKRDSVQSALGVLNRAVAADRGAMTMLIGSRVPCNDALMEDPTIQCEGDPPTVGPLGLVNGLFGSDPETSYGPIPAVFDDSERLLRFEWSPQFNLEAKT